MMDHVISESERANKGTVAEGNFSIFHDCLLQWWTPKAQEYMKAWGYEHRQLRSLPPTCAMVNTRYRWKLEGDSPELCRGLDLHGFADLDAEVTLNCSLATYYPKGHAMRAKWNLGNVGAPWNCMAKTWMMCAPTSDCIAEGIMKVVPVLDKIIEAKGGVVPDEFNAWAGGGGASTTAHGSPECGSARPRLSPGLTTRSSRGPQGGV